MRKLLLLLFMAAGIVANAQTNLYHEQFRPQFHFSPPGHWMNDPNGMLYFNGTYHLFYQYYPDSTVWGPMHWGHTTSTDLVHWQNHPIALYPDSLGLIFSGSAVVDSNNTAGLAQKKETPLVAVFTYHNMAREKAGDNNFQYQGMAYSLDSGATWKKYIHNPVLNNQGTRDFRDPSVSWYAPAQQWIMTLAVENRVEFYRSANLENWAYAGSFGKEEGNHGGVWECPNLFQLKCAETGESKWVLLVSVGKGAPNSGSGTQYFTGDFDGSHFKNDNNKSEVYWIDYGPDDYAGVTWSNAANGRRVFLGWMSNWDYAQQVPTKTWRSAMTVPRELSLHQTSSGYRVFAQPVDELKMLRTATDSINPLKKASISSALYEVELAFDLSGSNAEELGVRFSNDAGEQLKVGYNRPLNQFYIDRTEAGDTGFSPAFTKKLFAPRLSAGTLLKMHLLVDHSSVELFADDGAVSMTALFFPKKPLKNLQVYPLNGKAGLQQAVLYPLSSIWKQYRQQ